MTIPTAPAVLALLEDTLGGLASAADAFDALRAPGHARTLRECAALIVQRHGDPTPRYVGEVGG